MPADAPAIAPASRWRIDLEYDGAAFLGWQIQGSARTVQGAVEGALAAILGHEVRVQGAGRTDTGVHAEQQVAIFETPVQRAPRALLAGLNANLPLDVSCTQARVVPGDFDPRRAPHAKTYRYTFYDRPTRSPLRRARTWHSRTRLDVAAMHEAVQCMVGQHDFSSFRAQGCSSTHPIRTIELAEVTRSGDEVDFRIEGTGFLRHMIRIVAGTLVDVGRGTRDPAWFAGIVAARDRAAAGRTAPAEALTLERIVYRPEP